MFVKGIVLAVMVAQTAVSSGCGGQTTSSDQVQNANQEQSNLQAVQAVGFPNITHFSEKRQLKAIYELRDDAISTVTYIADFNGHLHKFCDSVGYGIPYATQYTNPQKIDYNSETYGGNVPVPQADPNGLYSPADAEGTWVLCLDPKSKKTEPVYVEPRVVVSPHELSVQ